jgi:hypothetical protein
MPLTTKIPMNSGNEKTIINIQELLLRLKSLENENNLEVVHLAIQSMIEEIREAIKK